MTPAHVGLVTGPRCRCAVPQCAAGLWADPGGPGIMPTGLGELTGVRSRAAVIDFRAHGEGAWPQSLPMDGQRLIGTSLLEEVGENATHLAPPGGR